MPQKSLVTYSGIISAIIICFSYLIRLFYKTNEKGMDMDKYYLQHM